MVSKWQFFSGSDNIPTGLRILNTKDIKVLGPKEGCWHTVCFIEGKRYPRSMGVAVRRRLKHGRK